MTERKQPHVFDLISTNPGVAMSVDSVHRIGEDTITIGQAMIEDGVSHDEAREALAETLGPDVDVCVGDEQIRRHRHGRFVVGFRRWNSSYDPHAQKANPNMN